MNVGAKIMYICENGYKLKDNRYTSVAECLNTGHWSANAECVIGKHTFLDLEEHWLVYRLNAKYIFDACHVNAI
jgi:hypothetical protein